MSIVTDTIVADTTLADAVLVVNEWDVNPRNYLMKTFEILQKMLKSSRFDEELRKSSKDALEHPCANIRTFYARIMENRILPTIIA
jgi:hypothetical protein